MKYNLIDTKYKELIFDIENFFKYSNKSIHKARNEIKIIDYENNRFAVKSFKEPNCINKIIYTYFKDSKAKKSYENSLKIIDFVPKPIAYIENYKLGLLSTSYFISENFDYDFTIREPLLDKNFEDKEDILKSFAQFTYDLHEQGIYHLDYSPGNILIKKENSKYIFKIVDINRMKFKFLSYEERWKNFAKLWIDDKDLKIIIKEYCIFSKENEEKSYKLALSFSHAHKKKIMKKQRFKTYLKSKNSF